MGSRENRSALAVIALTAIAAPVFAQLPDTPGNITIPPGRSQQSVPKSDEHRIVGTVLQIDRDAGLVKLATEEGVISVEVPPPASRVFRVGDTVSVPRSVADSPSASPRERSPEK